MSDGHELYQNAQGLSLFGGGDRPLFPSRDELVDAKRQIIDLGLDALLMAVWRRKQKAKCLIQSD